MGKKEKGLVPIRYRLRITRDELWGILNLVKYGAESYNSEGLMQLAKDTIKKYKEE